MPIKALLVHDTSLRGNHGSHIAVRQLINLAHEAGIDVVDRRPLHVSMNDVDTESIELVIVNGEGSMHHNSEAAVNISQIPAWSEERGLPSFLVNSVWQENRGTVVDGSKGFRGIWMRDQFSAEAIKADGLEYRGVADLTLTFEPLGSLHKNADNVVITDSTLKTVNAELFALSKRLRKARYLPWRAKPQELKGFPFDNGPNVKRFEKRKRFSRFQLKSLDRARYGNIIETPEELTSWLQAHASFLICGRYHAVTLAMTLGLPFVATPSNTFKVEALLDEAGLSTRLINGKLSDIRSLSNLAGFRQYNGVEKEKVAAVLSKHKEAGHTMFAEISRLTREAIK